ncbi:hypothetical protein BD413DRAFT_312874 [Trametes elegans]|nr:hypothetical protein BD413DRAFT_312874 [Trametes elegans]
MTESEVRRALHSARSTASLHPPLYGLPPLPPGRNWMPELRFASDANGEIPDSFADNSTDPQSLALRALWNAQRPVNKLPKALLAEILMYLPTIEFLPADEVVPQRWYHARLVCRRWWVTVNNDLRFWRDVQMQANLNWLRLAVVRTRRTVRSLTFLDANAAHSLDPELLQAISGRLESLRLFYFTRRCIPLHENLVEKQELPVLREFLMQYDLPQEGHTMTMDGWKYNAALMPRIERLSMTDGQIQWTIPLASRLRSLKLHRSHVWPEMNSDGFFTVLGHARHLEVLHISASTQPIAWDDEHKPLGSPRPTPELKLLNLRELYMEEPYLFVSRFLELVELPVGSHIELKEGPKYAWRKLPDDPAITPQVLMYILWSQKHLFLSLGERTVGVRWRSRASRAPAGCTMEGAPARRFRRHAPRDYIDETYVAGESLLVPKARPQEEPPQE